MIYSPSLCYDCRSLNFYFIESVLLEKGKIIFFNRELELELVISSLFEDGGPDSILFSSMQLDARVYTIKCSISLDSF